MFRSSFSEAWFVPIWTVSNAMDGDGVKQLLVEGQAMRWVFFTLDGNHGLKGLECLYGSFKADRSWLEVMLRSGLGRDRADEIVGQDVRPDFLPN